MWGGTKTCNTVHSSDVRSEGSFRLEPIGSTLWRESERSQGHFSTSCLRGGARVSSARSAQAATCRRSTAGSVESVGQAAVTVMRRHTFDIGSGSVWLRGRLFCADGLGCIVKVLDLSPQ